MGEKTHIGQIELCDLFTKTDADRLGANDIDVGEIRPVAGYSHISGYVYSDVDSASPDGFIIEQGSSQSDFAAGVVSTTNVTSSSIAIAGGNIVDNSLAVQVVAPFARVIYVNGGNQQNTYRAFVAARIIRGL